MAFRPDKIRKFFLLLLLELGFFFSNFFFFDYIKDKLRDYLALFESFGGEISSLQGMNVTSATDVSRLSSAVGSLERATQEATIFAFIIVPVVVFLIWFVFQSLIWFAAQREKIQNKTRFFLHFFVVSALIIVPYFLIVYPLLLAEIVYIEAVVLKIIGVTFVAYCVATLYYASINGAGVREDLLAPFRQIRLRTILLIFSGFVIALVWFFLFEVLLISRITKEYVFLSPVKLFAYILFVGVLATWVKTVLVSQHIRKLRE